MLTTARRRAILASLVCLLAAASCSTGTDPATTPVTLRPVVLGTIPAPADAFVEGLALVDNRLVMSTGAADQVSAVREIDPRTGAVLREQDVPGVFAEGVTPVSTSANPPVLWLLTWRDGLVVRLNARLRELDRRPLLGAIEGWGACNANDQTILTSDGTDRLTPRDPRTFDVTGATVHVTDQGRPVAGLNSLACADGAVWANAWPSDEIVRINQATGQVTARIDLAALHEQQHPDRSDPDAVPNGIALASDGTLWLAGKRWPNLLHVRLVQAPISTGRTQPTCSGRC